MPQAICCNTGGSVSEADSGKAFGPTDVPAATALTVDAFLLGDYKGGRLYMTLEDLTTGECSSTLVQLVINSGSAQYSVPSDLGTVFPYDIALIIIGTTLNVQVANNGSNTLRVTGHRLLF